MRFKAQSPQAQRGQLARGTCQFGWCQARPARCRSSDELCVMGRKPARIVNLKGAGRAAPATKDRAEFVAQRQRLVQAEPRGRTVVFVMLVLISPMTRMPGLMARMLLMLPPAIDRNAHALGSIKGGEKGSNQVRV